MDVQLDFYKSEYETLLKNYHLPPEQQGYTSLPSEALLACEQDSERYPVVILFQGQPVGFFVLHGWNGVKVYSENKDAILLRAYSVNQTLQGKGIGKKSIAIVPRFIKEYFPEKRELILAVNHGNEVAQHLYLKAGFIDKGTRVMGKKGEQLVLHMELQEISF